MTEVCGSAHRRLTSSVESALIGGLTLLLHVLPYLSDTMLMDLLQVCRCRALSLYLSLGFGYGYGT